MWKTQFQFSNEYKQKKALMAIVQLHILSYWATICWDLSFLIFSFLKRKTLEDLHFLRTGDIFAISNLYRTGKFITAQLRWQNPSSRVNDAQDYALFMVGPLGGWHYKNAEHCYWVAALFSLQQQQCFNGKVLVYLGKKMEKYSLVSNFHCQKIFSFLQVSHQVWG